MLNRLMQTIRLERDAFVWMDFNDRATGDAAILVAVSQALIAIGLGQSLLGLLNPLTLISLMINAVFLWVIYSGATYAISRYLLDGHGTYASFLRITGFAYPTLILIVFVSIFVNNALLAFVISGVWFVVIVANGVMYLADLAREKAFIAAIGGYILIVIVRTIFANLFSF
ncbi:MAG: YIP1 family protein [Actinomycetia bacterium]|nr:YIP1 family protein [Actinomycetes bacterium]